MEQALYELPEGWGWSSLAEQTRTTKNIKPIASPDQQFTYIDISSIDRNLHEIVEPKLIMGADAPSRAKKEVVANDVLFATTRPNLKNVAAFNGDVESPVASTGFCVLRASKTIDYRYLFYFLTTDFVQHQIAPYIAGAQYPAITDKNLKRVAIPLPPLDEQKRIVAKLDALFTRIDTAITHLQKTLELSKALFASVLDQSFSAGEAVAIGELAEIVQYGLSARSHSEGAFPFIRMGDLQGGEVLLDSLKYVDLSNQDFEKYALSKGDLLFNRTNSFELVGKTSLWMHDVPAVFASYLIRVRFPQGIVPAYVNYFLNSPLAQELLKGMAARAINQSNINATKLKSVKVPHPSVEVQNRIVTYLGSLAERTHALEAATEEKLNHLTALKASLLDAAFKGQLSKTGDEEVIDDG